MAEVRQLRAYRPSVTGTDDRVERSSSERSPPADTPWRHAERVLGALCEALAECGWPQVLCAVVASYIDCGHVVVLGCSRLDEEALVFAPWDVYAETRVFGASARLLTDSAQTLRRKEWAARHAVRFDAETRDGACMAARHCTEIVGRLHVTTSEVDRHCVTTYYAGSDGDSLLSLSSLHPPLGAAHEGVLPRQYDLLTGRMLCGKRLGSDDDTVVAVAPSPFGAPVALRCVHSLALNPTRTLTLSADTQFIEWPFASRAATHLVWTRAAPLRLVEEEGSGGGAYACECEGEGQASPAQLEMDERALCADGTGYLYAFCLGAYSEYKRAVVKLWCAPAQRWHHALAQSGLLYNSHATKHVVLRDGIHVAFFGGERDADGDGDGAGYDPEIDNSQAEIYNSSTGRWRVIPQWTLHARLPQSTLVECDGWLVRIAQGYLQMMFAPTPPPPEDSRVPGAGTADHTRDAANDGLPSTAPPTGWITVAAVDSRNDCTLTSTPTHAARQVYRAMAIGQVATLVVK